MIMLKKIISCLCCNKSTPPPPPPDDTKCMCSEYNINFGMTTVFGEGFTHSINIDQDHAEVAILEGLNIQVCKDCAKKPFSKTDLAQLDLRQDMRLNISDVGPDNSVSYCEHKTLSLPIQRIGDEAMQLLNSTVVGISYLSTRAHCEVGHELGGKSFCKMRPYPNSSTLADVVSLTKNVLGTGEKSSMYSYENNPTIGTTYNGVAPLFPEPVSPTFGPYKLLVPIQSSVSVRTVLQTTDALGQTVWTWNINNFGSLGIRVKRVYAELFVASKMGYRSIVKVDCSGYFFPFELPCFSEDAQNNNLASNIFKAVQDGTQDIMIGLENEGINLSFFEITAEGENYDSNGALSKNSFKLYSPIACTTSKIDPLTGQLVLTHPFECIIPAELYEAQTLFCQDLNTINNTKLCAKTVASNELPDEPFLQIMNLKDYEYILGYYQGSDPVYAPGFVNFQQKIIDNYNSSEYGRLSIYHLLDQTAGVIITENLLNSESSYINVDHAGVTKSYSTMISEGCDCNATLRFTSAAIVTADDSILMNDQIGVAQLVIVNAPNGQCGCGVGSWTLKYYHSSDPSTIIYSEESGLRDLQKGLLVKWLDDNGGLVDRVSVNIRKAVRACDPNIQLEAPIVIERPNDTLLQQWIDALRDTNNSQKPAMLVLQPRDGQSYVPGGFCSLPVTTQDYPTLTKVDSEATHLINHVYDNITAPFGQGPDPKIYAIELYVPIVPNSSANYVAGPPMFIPPAIFQNIETDWGSYVSNVLNPIQGYFLSV